MEPIDINYCVTNRFDLGTVSLTVAVTPTTANEYLYKARNDRNLSICATVAKKKSNSWKAFLSITEENSE